MAWWATCAGLLGLETIDSNWLFANHHRCCCCCCRRLLPPSSRSGSSGSSSGRAVSVAGCFETLTMIVQHRCTDRPVPAAAVAVTMLPVPSLRALALRCRSLYLSRGGDQTLVRFAIAQRHKLGQHSVLRDSQAPQILAAVTYISQAECKTHQAYRNFAVDACSPGGPSLRSHTVHTFGRVCTPPELYQPRSSDHFYLLQQILAPHHPNSSHKMAVGPTTLASKDAASATGHARTCALI